MHLVRVPVSSPAEADHVAGRLWSHGPVAVEDRGDVLVAGFESGVTARTLAGALGGEVVEPPAEETWRDAWRDHARPVRVGRVVVVPAWIDAPDTGGDDVVVRIEPGTAFGTGSHASTRLVLGLLQTLPAVGHSMLDVGCGSGVLSVAAARLGFSRVVAVDIAGEALEATSANALVNDVTIDVRAGSVDAAGGIYDVVVANIGAHVLRELAPELVACAQPAGGVIVVAGLLVEQVADVVAAFGHAGARMERVEADDGWAAPVLVRVD